MSPKTELYRLQFDACKSRAKTCRDPEMAALWLTVGSSYRFLMEREHRIDAEERERSERRSAGFQFLGFE